VKWTDKMDNMLRLLRRDGISASRSSEIISKHFGIDISRNAVIGRAMRLGLPQISARKAEIWARKRSTAPVLRGKKVVWGTGRDRRKAFSHNKASLPRLKSEPVPPPADDDIPTKTLMELEPGDCRWRVDKPLRNEPYGFCAKEALPGLSVCAQHAPRQFANWAEVKHKYVKPVEAREKEAV
jgi:GcrA cell cycle regulator